MIYSYYFEVPSDASTELLEIMDWEIGQVISDIPAELFENNDFS